MRVQASHPTLYPLYDLLDHTNQIFSESLWHHYRLTHLPLAHFISWPTRPNDYDDYDNDDDYNDYKDYYDDCDRYDDYDDLNLTQLFKQNSHSLLLSSFLNESIVEWLFVPYDWMNQKKVGFVTSPVSRHF